MEMTLPAQLQRLAEVARKSVRQQSPESIAACDEILHQLMWMGMERAWKVFAPFFALRARGVR